MAKFDPPGKFDFDAGTKEAWEAWSKRWTRYRAVTKLDAAAETEQVNALVYTMGAEAEGIFAGLPLTADERKVYQTVFDAFGTYFSPRKNVIFERAQFYRRDQQEGESVELFVRALRNMAEGCNFGEKRSEQIRDRLVVGTRDLELSKEMQRMAEEDLDEAKVISLLRQAESVREQMNKLHHTPQITSRVDLVQRRPESSEFRGAAMTGNAAGRGKPRRRPGQPQPKGNATESTCGKCGHSKHLQGELCPAANAKCFACGKIGHFGRCCRAKGQGVYSMVEEGTQVWQYAGGCGSDVPRSSRGWGNGGQQ